MSEPVDSKISTAESPVAPEAGKLLIKAAASDTSAAYELDYFREFSRHAFFKPAGSDRANMWKKAEDNYPQFAEQITALGSAIPQAQHATEQAGASVPILFGKIVNPVARELMANILTIRLGLLNRPFKAREVVGLVGQEESERMINSLGVNEETLRLFSTTDLMEAYLDGRLSLDKTPSNS